MGCLDGGCPEGQACVEDPDACAPSSCFCEEDGWVCTDDCGPGNVCVPETTGCDEPDPSITCQDTGCATGEICVPADTDACVPSDCTCEDGGWVCTDDCGSDYVCVDDTGCSTPDPSETCLDTGCPDGFECIVEDPDACLPGFCECDPTTDTWGCTEDSNPSYFCATLIGDVCPDEEPPIGEACDPDINTELCGWGSECCCGECYNSIECTCSDDGTWACYATDACFIESCAGRECDEPSDCEGGAFSLACVDGFCAREAVNCDGLEQDTCGDTDGCRWYYGGPCSDGADGIRLDESACLPDLPCESTSDCPEGTECTTYEVTPWCAVPEDPSDPACGACSMPVSICAP